VPVTGPVNVIPALDTPLHCILLTILATVAVGLTVIVYVLTVPVHPLAVGVIVIVAVIGDGVPLVAVNAGMSPKPLAASPTAVLLFVQVNVVPLTGPDKEVSRADAPAQYV
jgi:hypothetical protein